VSISKDGDVFVVSEPELERIVSRVDMTDPTIQGQVLGQMTRLHVDKLWKKAGISGKCHPLRRCRMGMVEFDEDRHPGRHI